MLGLATEAAAQTCTTTDVAITGVTPAPSDPAALAGDCTTLLGFMDTLRGTASLNWATTLSMESWDGITLTSDGNRVAELGLGSRSLTGSIPDLSPLTSLRHLSLQSNELTGSIPDLSPLTSLRHLSLQDNELTGSIPDLSALTNLELLQLHKNELTGNIPDLSALANLEVLYLHENELTGSIPDLSALANLQRLAAEKNRLTGSIPDLSALTNLTDLWLYSNELTGNIVAGHFPASIQRIEINDNELTGSIPDLSALTNLARLLLSDNELTGSIPDLSALTNLQALWLHRNELTGSIVAEHFPASLQQLTLSENGLTGNIPDLSALTNLQFLLLQRNQLSGTLPTWWGSLSSLQWLHLAGNPFTGGIPSQLGSLTNLAQLSLCGTNLDAAATLPSALETRRTTDGDGDGNNDLTVVSCLRIEDSSAIEGSALSFAVEHSTYPIRGVAGATGGLTVSYETEDGTATSADYTGTAGGSVTIAANTDTDDSTSSATISVPTTADTVADDGETMTVTLSPPEGSTWNELRALPLRDSATGTILDAATPVVSFASSSSSALESVGTRNVTVNLSPAPSTATMVSYTVGGNATEGSDYSISGSGALSVSMGATTATLAVAITDDTAEENDETVILTLTQDSGYTVGSPNRHTLTITDNDGALPPPVSLSACDPCNDHPGSQLLFLADTGIPSRAHAPTDTPQKTAPRNVSEWLGATEAAQRNFISVANTADEKAVTVLVQYHNDEMEPVLWYLRVLPAGANVLVDPFNHEIPGTTKEVGSGPVNVRDILFDEIPAVSFKDETGRVRAGFNSGRFLIAVTAVGAHSKEEDRIPEDPSETVNILFPDYLAESLHGANNIDAIGDLGFQTVAQFATDRHPQEYEKESTGRNVGPLTVHNYKPIAFNNLIGHHTAAEVSTVTGGIAWGVDALVRPAVTAPSDDGPDHRIGVAYAVLSGTNAARLAPRVHGGVEAINAATDEDNRGDDSGDGPPVAHDPTPTENNRVVTGGALIWPSLYENDHMDQRVEFLSVADDYGEPGEYRLIGAKTIYRVRLFDPKGNELPDPIWVPPVYGPIVPPPLPGLYILVDGIGVMSDASPMLCTGNPRVQGWSLSDLTDLVPTARTGDGDFQGLDVGLDPNLNAAPGWVVFQRTTMTCTEDYGDGDPSSGLVIEIPDGVPTQDKRSFIGGTLVVEKETSHRTFVTAGQAVLRFLTPTSAFAASWWLTVK